MSDWFSCDVRKVACQVALALQVVTRAALPLTIRVSPLQLTLHPKFGFETWHVPGS